MKRGSVRPGGVLLLGIALVALLLACGRGGAPQANSSAAPASTGGRPITIVDSFAVSSMDPVLDGAYLLRFGMGEMLGRVTRAGTLEPWLAAGWRAVDPLLWEIKLREGVLFWDGTPLDAALAKASLERTLARDGSARETLKATAIEAVDPLTLHLRTATPNAALPAALAEWRFIIHQARLAESQGDAAFARQPVLTGPFRPVEFRPDEVIRLARNETYWGGAPALDRLDVRFVVDATTRLLALQSGEVDVVMNVPADAVPALRTQPGVRLHEVLGGSNQMLLLRPGSPPLDDVRLRRAIGLAIDRDALANQVLGGTSQPAGGIYSSLYAWAGKEGYAADQAAAARLLDEAGWLHGADGVRQSNGQRLALTFLWYPQRPDLQPLAVAIQARLRALGVRVELRAAEQIDAALKRADWHGSLYYNNTAPAADPQYFLDTFVRSGGGFNFGFASPELDRAVERARGTLDAAERQRLVGEVQRAVAEQAWILPLVTKKELFAVGHRLPGFQPHPISVYLVDAQFGR